MRFTRLTKELSESVTELQPEVRETLVSVRTAADTATIVLAVAGIVIVMVSAVWLGVALTSETNSRG